MTKYIVLADELVGLKGAKYGKGDNVNETFFPPHHMKSLEEKSLVEKVKKLEPKKEEKK